MRIKGADGHEYDVASSGVGGTGLGLGIAGTALGLLNGGGNGLLGGLLGGNRCGCGGQDAAISRYEATMLQELAAKDAKIGLLESNIYTDQKISAVYEKLANKIDCNKAAQDAVNLQQASYNAANTSAIGCMQSQIAQLFGITKLVVPNSSVCPGWGDVTITPATTTTA